MNAYVNIRETGWLTQEYEFQILILILDSQKSLVICIVTLMISTVKWLLTWACTLFDYLPVSLSFPPFLSSLP